MSDNWELPAATRIGRTALIVSDLGAMVEFYRDVVGLRVKRESAGRAVLGAGGAPLLVLERDADAPSRRREQTGLFHTAFRVPSRAALGAALERIEAESTLSGASHHHVSEALYLDDPEGNGVEIYRDLPEETWPRREDGTIGIGTVPLDLDAVAAASDGTASAPAGTVVGHVHLEVSSLEATRELYVETLGLGVKTELESALFLAAGDYHHHLGANTWNRRTEPAGGRGLAWFEFVVPDGAAMDDVRRCFAASDLPHEEVDGGVSIEDPDGIELRFRGENDR